MTNIGQNIMNRRKELNLTQEELAKKMGYKSKSTINKIELGINDISQSKILKFAQVLNTTPAILMGWVEKTTNDQLTVHGFEKDLVISYRNADELDKAIVKRTLKLDDTHPNLKNA